MRSSPDLFNLIHSLSEPERRYFRIHSQLHVKGGQNNYLRLFDAILSQDQFDEEALKAKFSGESFLNQFSVAKSYLRGAIMRALRAYHRNASPEFQLRELLDFAALCQARGLNAQAAKHLRKASKIAREQEHFPLLLDVMVKQLRLVKQEWQAGKESQLASAYQDLRQVLGQLENEIAYRHLHDQVYSILAMKVELRSQKEPQLAGKLMQDDLLTDPGKALSWNAQIVFHYTHAFHGRLTGDPEKMQAHYQAMVTLWEGSPNRIRQEEERFLKTLSGYLDCCLLANDTLHFQEGLDKIKAYKAGSAKLKALAFRITHFLELRYFLLRKEYDQAQVFAERIENGLESYAAYISNDIRILFAYNLTVLFFLGNKHSNCLKWAMKIVNAPAQNVREDVRMAVRIF